MFKRILVPVDFTEKSLKAVDMAHDLAVQSGAEVILLHVIERIEHLDSDELKPFYDRLAKSARKGLLEFSERFVADSVKVVDAIMYGKRTQEIVRFAIENNADLIIMASHRIDPDRPGHDWSSISYAVAILAPCAVLLAK
jgi:nucleotide-binding universal stress UspA family protein